ncbi:MAG: polysulfide reductase NrfD [Planctomycetaceae bacterium]|nr:polysulfide reductase NrfD [Planctomycetaceae bacterium]
MSHTTHTDPTLKTIPNAVRIPYSFKFEKAKFGVRVNLERWTFLFTPMRVLLILFTLFALAVMGWRFLMGLEAVTNLNDHWPWGLWKAMAVFSGVALAGGGYGTAFLVHVLHIKRLQPVARITMLASLLGYLLVLGGLFLEIGRWFNFWPPFYSWGHASPLFEIFICISAYTVVQVGEMCEVVTEKVFRKLNRILLMFMPLLIILGVMLPSMHQSSLGALYILAAGKLHPLWWSPLIWLFFLMTSLFVGPAMVAVTSVLTDKCLGHKIPVAPMRFLARIGGVLMLVYLAIRFGDLAHRNAVGEIFSGNFESYFFMAELLIGVIIPIFIVFSPLANSRGWLILYGFLASFGVFFNRANVVITGMWRDTGVVYYPSFFEVVIALGLVSTAVLAFLYLCENFSILKSEHD